MEREYESIVSDRLKKIESGLAVQYRLLGAAEDGINQSQSSIDRERYEISIEAEIKPKIRCFEEQYFVFVEGILGDRVFQEEDVDLVLKNFSSEIERINRRPDNYPEEFLKLLEQINEKLSQPNVTADAKLKASISLLPPFIGLSYDAQLDTEGFCRKYFPNFVKLLKRSKKK